MNNFDALLILNTIAGMTNTRIRKLIDHCGSACEALRASKNRLNLLGIVSAKVAESIAQFPQEEFLKQEHALLEKHDVRILSYTDREYPQSLLEISDAPVVLYVKGKIPCDVPSIGIVGSRRASIYGVTIAEQFGCRLAEYGIHIVSGMARGIDTAAHKGVLKARGLTTAVLGCGLAHVYPKENDQLMEEIACNGAVISEFSMQTPPVSFNFPRRNRIISGLSSGVIVVEAARRSGALITADCALEQGREVYAVPGKVDIPGAQGTNDLIKQGAKLVTCVEDILEDLKPELERHISNDVSAKEKCQKDFDLTQQEENIYNHISDRPIHIDELYNQCGSSIAVSLMQLELKQCVKQLPGKFFVRGHIYG